MSVSLELSLLNKGLREKWPIPENARKRAIARITATLETSEDIKEVLKAAEVLVQMDKVNVSRERIYSPKAHIDVSSLTNDQLFKKLEGVFIDNPQLRERFLNDNQGRQAALPEE